MAASSYAIALGSNRRHGRFGAPPGVLVAAVAALGELGEVERISRIRATPALGPAGRNFANAALLLRSALGPDELLAALKAIEWGFGRRSGRRWGARVLDLDIILWSEGTWGGPGPTIPHPEFRERDFVLAPLAEIVPDWRDPVAGFTIRQLRARLARRRRLSRSGPGQRAGNSRDQAKL